MAASSALDQPASPAYEQELDDSGLRQFAADVAVGLTASVKSLSPRYLYDELGSALFDAITLLPEYGLTRADERLLSVCAPDVARHCGSLSAVAELGSGSGKKTTHVLRAARHYRSDLLYLPIDVSAAALTTCSREIGELCQVYPLCSDWVHGLRDVARLRLGDDPLLLLFLGSSIGNLERSAIPDFLAAIRSQLRAGDFFLLGADLEKDVPSMLQAYDDPSGVTAAFNLNLLGRMNRELGADFQLRSFRHEARWSPTERRIEMHLVSRCEQVVNIPKAGVRVHFAAGESFWTESSHKFRAEDLRQFARNNGFVPVAEWVDTEWPFTEVLWRVS